MSWTVSSDSNASERTRPAPATAENPWCLIRRRAVFKASCGSRPSRAACSFRRSAWVRRAAQLFVAQGAVLDPMRAAGREQVPEDGELVVLRQLGRLGLDREGTLRRF